MEPNDRSRREVNVNSGYGHRHTERYRKENAEEEAERTAPPRSPPARPAPPPPSVPAPPEQAMTYAQYIKDAPPGIISFPAGLMAVLPKLEDTRLAKEKQKARDAKNKAATFSRPITILKPVQIQKVLAKKENKPKSRWQDRKLNLWERMVPSKRKAFAREKNIQTIVQRLLGNSAYEEYRRTMFKMDERQRAKEKEQAKNKSMAAVVVSMIRESITPRPSSGMRSDSEASTSVTRRSTKNVSFAKDPEYQEPQLPRSVSFTSSSGLLDEISQQAPGQFSTPSGPPDGAPGRVPQSPPGGYNLHKPAATSEEWDKILKPSSLEKTAAAQRPTGRSEISLDATATQYLQRPRKMVNPLPKEVGEGPWAQRPRDMREFVNDSNKPYDGVRVEYKSLLDENVEGALKEYPALLDQQKLHDAKNDSDKPITLNDVKEAFETFNLDSASYLKAAGSADKDDNEPVIHGLLSDDDESTLVGNDIITATHGTKANNRTDKKPLSREQEKLMSAVHPAFRDVVRNETTSKKIKEAMKQEGFFRVSDKTRAEKTEVYKQKYQQKLAAKAKIEEVKRNRAAKKARKMVAHRDKRDAYWQASLMARDWEYPKGTLIGWKRVIGDARIKPALLMGRDSEKRPTLPLEPEEARSEGWKFPDKWTSEFNAYDNATLPARIKTVEDAEKENQRHENRIKGSAYDQKLMAEIVIPTWIEMMAEKRAKAAAARADGQKAEQAGASPSKKLSQAEMVTKQQPSKDGLAGQHTSTEGVSSLSRVMSADSNKTTTPLSAAPEVVAVKTLRASTSSETRSRAATVKSAVRSFSMDIPALRRQSTAESTTLEEEQYIDLLRRENAICGRAILERTFSHDEAAETSHPCIFNPFNKLEINPAIFDYPGQTPNKTPRSKVETLSRLDFAIPGRNNVIPVDPFKGVDWIRVANEYKHGLNGRQRLTKPQWANRFDVIMAQQPDPMIYFPTDLRFKEKGYFSDILPKAPKFPKVAEEMRHNRGRIWMKHHFDQRIGLRPEDRVPRTSVDADGKKILPKTAAQGRPPPKHFPQRFDTKAAACMAVYQRLYDDYRQKHPKPTGIRGKTRMIHPNAPKVRPSDGVETSWDHRFKIRRTPEEELTAKQLDENVPDIREGDFPHAPEFERALLALAAANRSSDMSMVDGRRKSMGLKPKPGVTGFGSGPAVSSFSGDVTAAYWKKIVIEPEPVTVPEAEKSTDKGKREDTIDVAEQETSHPAGRGKTATVESDKESVASATSSEVFMAKVRARKQQILDKVNERSDAAKAALQVTNKMAADQAKNGGSSSKDLLELLEDKNAVGCVIWLETFKPQINLEEYLTKDEQTVIKHKILERGRGTGTHKPVTETQAIEFYRFVKARKEKMDTSSSKAATDVEQESGFTRDDGDMNDPAFARGLVAWMDTNRPNLRIRTFLEKEELEHLEKHPNRTTIQVTEQEAMAFFTKVMRRRIEMNRLQKQREDKAKQAALLAAQAQGFEGDEKMTPAIATALIAWVKSRMSRVPVEDLLGADMILHASKYQGPQLALLEIDVALPLFQKWSERHSQREDEKIMRAQMPKPVPAPNAKPASKQGPKPESKPEPKPEPKLASKVEPKSAAVDEEEPIPKSEPEPATEAQKIISSKPGNPEMVYQTLKPSMVRAFINYLSLRGHKVTHPELLSFAKLPEDAPLKKFAFTRREYGLYNQMITDIRADRERRRRALEEGRVGFAHKLTASTDPELRKKKEHIRTVSTEVTRFETYESQSGEETTRQGTMARMAMQRGKAETSVSDKEWESVRSEVDEGVALSKRLLSVRKKQSDSIGSQKGTPPQVEHSEFTPAIGRGDSFELKAAGNQAGRSTSVGTSEGALGLGLGIPGPSTPAVTTSPERSRTISASGPARDPKTAAKIAKERELLGTLGLSPRVADTADSPTLPSDTVTRQKRPTLMGRATEKLKTVSKFDMNFRARKDSFIGGEYRSSPLVASTTADEGSDVSTAGLTPTQNESPNRADKKDDAVARLSQEPRRSTFRDVFHSPSVSSWTSAASSTYNSSPASASAPDLPLPQPQPQRRGSSPAPATPEAGAPLVDPPTLAQIQAQAATLEEQFLAERQAKLIAVLNAVDEALYAADLLSKKIRKKARLAAISRGQKIAPRDKIAEVLYGKGRADRWDRYLMRAIEHEMLDFEEIKALFEMLDERKKEEKSGDGEVDGDKEEEFYHVQEHEERMQLLHEQMEWEGANKMVEVWREVYAERAAMQHDGEIEGEEAAENGDGAKEKVDEWSDDDIVLTDDEAEERKKAAALERSEIEAALVVYGSEKN